MRVPSDSDNNVSECKIGTLLILYLKTSFKCDFVSLRIYLVYHCANFCNTYKTPTRQLLLPKVRKVSMMNYNVSWFSNC